MPHHLCPAQTRPQFQTVDTNPFIVQPGRRAVDLRTSTSRRQGESWTGGYSFTSGAGQGRVSVALEVGRVAAGVRAEALRCSSGGDSMGSVTVTAGRYCGNPSGTSEWTLIHADYMIPSQGGCCTTYLLRGARLWSSGIGGSE